MVRRDPDSGPGLFGMGCAYSWQYDRHDEMVGCFRRSFEGLASEERTALAPYFGDAVARAYYVMVPNMVSGFDILKDDMQGLTEAFCNGAGSAFAVLEAVVKKAMERREEYFAVQGSPNGAYIDLDNMLDSTIVRMAWTCVPLSCGELCRSVELRYEVRSREREHGLVLKDRYAAALGGISKMMSSAIEDAGGASSTDYWRKHPGERAELFDAFMDAEKRYANSFRKPYGDETADIEETIRELTLRYAKPCGR